MYRYLSSPIKINKLELKERTAKNYMTPSDDRYMIGYLLLRGYIELHPNGILISNPELVASMMMSRRDS